MKYKIFKKNKGPAQYRSRKTSGSGFVLLFAVTLAALLLSIALGVANIALKEVKFGTSAKDAGNAFFAADTGAEQALFNDKSTSYSPAPGAWSFVISGLGSDAKSCARVSITKDIPNPPNIQTTIISDGYNNGGGTGVCNPTANTVERELKTIY